MYYGMRNRNDIVAVAYQIGRELRFAHTMGDDVTILRLELAFKVLHFVLDPYANDMDVNIIRHRYDGSISDMEKTLNLYFENLL